MKYPRQPLGLAAALPVSRREMLHRMGAGFGTVGLAGMIAQDIHRNLNRGVTFLEGTGAYAQKRTKVILTVVSVIDLQKLKALILNQDRDAFVIINDTLAVLGNRFDPLDIC